MINKVLLNIYRISKKLSSALKKTFEVAQIKKVLVCLVAGVGFEPTTFRL